MLFEVTLTLAAAVFLFALLAAWSTAPLFRRTKRGISPTNLLILGTFLGLGLYFFPLSYLAHGGSTAPSALFPTVVATVIKAMSTFVGEGDYFGAIETFAAVAPAELFTYYRTVGVILHISAPLLTFGFILSFVKNASAMVRYRLSFLRPAHIFSELNEESVALARSIVTSYRHRHPFLLHALLFFRRPVIVFTDVVDKREEADYDLVSESEKMGAILFRKDLESVRFRLLHFGRRLHFYLLHNSETERARGEGEKLRHAAHLMREYDESGVSLFLFSNTKESELFLSARGAPDKAAAPRPLMPSRQRVVRIDAVQSLIYHNLDRYGLRLFNNAHRLNGNKIHSVIVGLGQYGQEMLRALSWYTQVTGFSLEINAFDEAPEARDRLTLQYPEMMARGEAQAAGAPAEEGEANYRITVHSGIDVSGDAFFERLDALAGVTHVFVSLGSDEKNIAMAAAIRARFNSRADHLPDIEAVVYDSDLAERMGMTWDECGDASTPENETVDGAFVRKQPYRVHMFGDLGSFYSVDTVINSALAEAGHRVHMRYNAYFSDDPEAVRLLDEVAALEKGGPHGCTRGERKRILGALRGIKEKYGDGYYDNEYNYRSSIAKCIAERLREQLVDCGYIALTGIHTPWGERSPEEKQAIGRFEHPRWNAYMRAQGYTLGPRDDLAKHHPNLVNLAKLSDEDIRKDS